jgi:hypothetical protein
MELLAAKKVSVDQAKATASLAKQANNLLRYELDRAKAEAKLFEINKANQTDFKIREIEEMGQVESDEK